MLRQLQGHLTDQQLSDICNVIIARYKKYKQYTNTSAFQSMFSNEYAPHNKKCSLSWSISSAFPSGSTVSGLKVSRLDYGRGHKRPCLNKPDLELMILNDTTNFQAEYLIERYKYNANDFINQKLFAYVRFVVKDNHLKNITLCVPDENGSIVAEKVMLDSDAIEALAA